MAVYSPTIETTQDPTADAPVNDVSLTYSENNPDESAVLDDPIDTSVGVFDSLEAYELPSLGPIVDTSYTERPELHAPAAMVNRGIRIPAGDFRRVAITCLNSEGEPLKRARWIQSAGFFPTAGRVLEQEDGSMVGFVWLLNVDYEDMAVLAENDRAGAFDYVWYQASGGIAVPQGAREVTLSFVEADAPPPGAPPSLAIGGGINFG